MMMSCDDAGTKAIQRFEVFTAAGRRRVWSADDKAMIVAGIFTVHDTVCAMARRNGLGPSQPFTWWHQLRKTQGSGVFANDVAPMFVPAVIASSPVSPPVASKRPSPDRRPRSPRAAAVELAIDYVTVRIGHGADACVITAVI